MKTKMKKSEGKLEAGNLGYYIEVGINKILNEKSYGISHLNPKVKFQGIDFTAQKLAFGIRATVWRNVLKKYVINLKGGNKKIIQFKSLYPTLEIPFENQKHVIHSSMRTMSCEEWKWHKIDFDGEYETIEGVETISDDSEFIELKKKYEKLQEKYHELKRRLEASREYETKRK